MDPQVSFVVPCYRLAHLLGECLNSILSQTYQNFEILIMDDCSPDNTGEVAQSIGGSRIRYIRNEPNLGHLRNYNKGIELSRGEFVWLISADDRLASPYILERYMAAFAAHPTAGYVFCPALGRVGDRITGTIPYTQHGTQDTFWDGRQFLLNRLLKDNGIAAASGLVRKECYQKVSLFPLDMPYGGDWYLWCMFALHYDVAYLAEPMVEYRQHDLAMCATLSQENIRKCIDDDVVLHRRIGAEAERLGFHDIAAMCAEQNAVQFGRYLSGVSIRGTIATMSVEDMESRLAAMVPEKGERNHIAALAYVKAGDKFFWKQDYPEASLMYRKALCRRQWWPTVWGRCLLASGNALGSASRKLLMAIRSTRVNQRASC